MNLVKKWFTRSEYVDIETGEILHKSQILRDEYLVINKEYKTVQHEKFTERKFLYHCTRNRQQRLEF